VVNIIQYIPPVLHDIEEVKNICRALSEECDRLDVQMDATYNNQFVYTLDANGCKRWEEMLNIQTVADDDLDTRRFRILGSIMADIPYTKNSLKKVLDGMLGRGLYTIDIDNGNFKVKVRLTVKNYVTFDICVDTINRMIPANMISEVSILFNTYGTLKKQKYSDFAGLSYGEIATHDFD